MADISGWKTRLCTASDVPTPASGKVHLFFDVADGQPKYKDSSGTTNTFPSVNSFNSRTGAITPAQADYDSFFLTPAEGNAAYQPLDSDLTAIAALTTTSYGRSFLDRADAAAGRTLLALGTAATNNTGDFQPIDATLTALAGANWAANTVPVGSGTDTVSQLSVTANTFPARSSSGNVVAKPITDYAISTIAGLADAAALTAAINPATTSLPGAMSVSDKKQLNNQYYDIVADGGADPTGSVDATSIIQAANDSFGATGGIIFFPVGTYKVTATINIDKKVTLRGANREQSVISMTHASQDVFNVTADFARFETIRIVGATAGTRTGGFAINFHLGADNCSCWCVDILFMWSAVSMSGQLCRCEDMNIREMGANASAGCLILIDQFKDQYIHGIVSDNGSNPTGFAGVRITNLSSLVMSDCDFIHAGTCLDLAPTTTNTIPSIYVSNTFFDNSVIGASFTGASGTIQRVHFVNAWFASCSTAGVVLNAVNTNDVTFESCQFYGNPFGIDAQAATDWCVRNSTFAGNTTNAIRTTAAATHSFTIAGNFIGNAGGFGANAQGINIQAGTYKRYAIADNRGLETNTTKGMIDLGVVAAGDQKYTAPNLGGLLSGAMATLGAPVTSVNTTEFLLISARIPANSVKIGDTFRIRMFGLSNGTGTLIFKIKAGANGTIADNQATINVATAAQVANQRASIDGLLVVRSIGAGTCAAEFVGMANAINISPTVAAAATAAITTTADWFIDLTVTVSASTFTALTAVIEAI